jgi:DNA mismatch endonuclease (patch repair protein)
MADVFTSKKRSEIMSRVKSRGNAATEMRLIEIFREHKITGWRRRARLFGNPDFIFAKSKVAVFVDGCFWHGCPRHGALPRTNRAFWYAKLTRNKRRDRLVNKTLAVKGWTTVRIWQHQLRESKSVARKFRRLLGKEFEAARLTTLR